MTPPRVLEVITPSGIGGAEVFVTEFCRRMRLAALEAELFCPAGRPLVGYAASRGITCVGWKTRGKLDPLTVVRLAKLVRRGRFDVVHTHLSTASLLGAIAARLSGVPSVAHVHGLNTATCFRLSTRVIAVSSAVRDHLCAQGLGEGKISVVHNGVDTESFRPIPSADAKRSLGLDTDGVMLGVFGRLSEEKGQRVALEAMFLLTVDRLDARLTIVGQGPDLDSLRVSARALGIEDRVEFVGFLDDVRGWMSACDVVVAPSLREGLGLAAIEAMALERPVVASSAGGLKEVVEDGTTGFLVAPNDPRALADRLSLLIDRPDLRDRMGRLGRLRVLEHFEIEKQMGKVIEHLRIAAEPGAPHGK